MHPAAAGFAERLPFISFFIILSASAVRSFRRRSLKPQRVCKYYQAGERRLPPEEQHGGTARDMNKKLKVLLIVLGAAVLFIAAVVVFVVVSGTHYTRPPVQPELSDVPTASPPRERADKPSPLPSPAEADEPDPEDLLTANIAAAGDLVMNSGLITEAMDKDGNFSFASIFGITDRYIKNADYAVCSLATTFSGGTAYTAHPLYKSPDILATSIAGVGFDLVNTATSHAVDSGKAGISYTLDTLEAAGLSHVGTYRTPEERAETSGAAFADVNGIKIAFVSYTCDTNQVAVSGFDYAVNVCTEDYLTGRKTVKYDLIEADLKAAHDSGADVIFVFMSWGDLLGTEPNRQQQEMADFLFAHGADVIVGGHTRVPQKMEKVEAEDIYGVSKERFVCYSLGNLLSCLNDEYTNISAILNIGFTKNTKTGETTISSVKYDPIYMADLYDFGIEDFNWHYRLVDLHAAINSYESGDTWNFMTGAVYSDMVSSLGDLHMLLGEEFDRGDTAESSGRK